MRPRPIFLLLGLVAAPSAAMADPPDPKFAYEAKVPPPPPVAKGPEWKAAGQAGLMLTTGNSRTSTVSGGLDASRFDGDNKLSLSLTGAYAKSTVLVLNDANGDGLVGPGEIGRLNRTNSKAYGARLRYDRFFTESNAGYVTGLAAADEPAGKDFFGGAQAGYSRQVFKDDMHELVLEAGYDFTYEDFVAPGVDALSIHSLRTMVGYNVKLAEGTSVSASMEALFNLNQEKTAVGTFEAFDDTRLYGKLGVTAAVRKDIAVRLGFQARYDNAPAPLAPIGGATFAPGFIPQAEKLDTTTDLSLIVSFL